MAIPLAPFERQFRELLAAHAEGRQPLVSAQQGVEALEIVEAIYLSCRTGRVSDIDRRSGDLQNVTGGTD